MSVRVRVGVCHVPVRIQVQNAIGSLDRQLTELRSEHKSLPRTMATKTNALKVLEQRQRHHNAELQTIRDEVTAIRKQRAWPST
jgi:chromosome segregation ATPase